MLFPVKFFSLRLLSVTLVTCCMFMCFFIYPDQVKIVLNNTSLFQNSHIKTAIYFILPQPYLIMLTNWILEYVGVSLFLLKKLTYMTLLGVSHCDKKMWVCH